MRKIQKMCAALLAGVMTVGTFAPSVFADEAAKELTDEQVINVCLLYTSPSPRD